MREAAQQAWCLRRCEDTTSIPLFTTHLRGDFSLLPNATSCTSLSTSLLSKTICRTARTGQAAKLLRQLSDFNRRSRSRSLSVPSDRICRGLGSVRRSSIQPCALLVRLLHCRWVAGGLTLLAFGIVGLDRLLSFSDLNLCGPAVLWLDLHHMVSMVFQTTLNLGFTYSWAIARDSSCSSDPSTPLRSSPPRTLDTSP